MKKLNILKTLLDLFFFFLLFAVAGLVIFAAIAIIGDEPIPLKIKGQSITVAGWPGKLLITFIVASFTSFVYAIYLLRKVILHFVKREIFHVKIIGYFKTIGVCLIAAAFLQTIPLFVYNMIYRNHIGFEFGIDGFDSFLPAIGLGLFFMVLSEVFKIAKNIKEENELTV